MQETPEKSKDEARTELIRGRRIMVIDDHRNIRVSLRLTLESEGGKIFEAETVKGAMEKLGHLDRGPQGFQYDCVLLDIRMPDGSGLDVLKALSDAGLASRVIMISGEGTVTDAFKATQMGAFDYIEKPFGEERIIVTVARCLAFNRIRSDKEKLEQQVLKNQEMLGEHPRIQDVMKLIRRVAPTNGRVLISGESGTGKELVARAIHRESSRSDRPLIKVNCAAIPHSLIESELFGHEKGSFTGAVKQRQGVFERADSGTLFLDEIGELSLELQAKLLSAIEDRRLRRLGGSTQIEIDVQILAASNRNLFERVRDGAFRSDLYHRIAVFTLELPALRARKEDLDDLVPLFIDEYNAKAGKSIRTVPESVWSILRSYDWPGNVRELRNAIERCVLLSDTHTLAAEWLQFPPTRNAENGRKIADRHSIELPLDGSLTLEEMEKQILVVALEKSHHSVSGAARLLGASRETIRYRVNKFGLKFRE
jgi:DNA-binding NtrC family response regulator